MVEEQKKKVVISYCRDDSEGLEILHLFLKALPVDLWVDRNKKPGEWDPQIREKFRDADAAVLLVTQRFLVSDYIQRTEIPILKEGQRSGRQIIFPIIWEQCNYKQHTWVGTLEAFLAGPDGRQPVGTLKKLPRAQALTQFSQKLMSALEAHQWQSESTSGQGGESLGGKAKADDYYLRRRLRFIPNASAELTAILSDIVTTEHGPKDNPRLLQRIERLASFERTMGMAVLQEDVGQVTAMLDLLNGVFYYNDEEACRRLYRGIGYEKLWDHQPTKLWPAMVDYVWILSRPGLHPVLHVCARFNASVCLEKLELYRDVDFNVFIENRSLTMPMGERVWHKALIMEIITCMKAKWRPFKPEDALVEMALDEQREIDPPGYAKTLIMWRRFKGIPPTTREVQEIYALEKRMPVNARAAILTELATDLSANGQVDEVELIHGKVRALADSSKDPTILKYLNKMTALMQRRSV